MHSFRRLFAIILGMVFLCSGFVKLIDPVGTGLIVSEYFNWMHLGFMKPASKILGFLLSLSETCVGVAVLTGVWRRVTAVIAMTMTVFFTLISAALVVFNPVMDCGCFGEFIHLTHMQTLVKNIILCLISAIAFLPVWDLGIPQPRKTVSFFMDISLVLAVAVYSWMNIPYFDFTDFRISNAIVPEYVEEHSDVTVTLALWDAYGEDVSDTILQGDVALVSVYHPEDMDDKDIARIAQFSSSAFNEGYSVYVLSSSLLDIPGVECFIADYKSLVTLNRSNGGATLLSGGVIADKTSKRHYFSSERLEELIAEGPEDYAIGRNTKRDLAFQIFSIVFLLIALI